MAGSGGGTSQTLQDYQMDSHFLILAGSTVDASPVTWDGTTAADGIPHLGGTYAASPSVLRFILEQGTTAVGGNPFEGVSAYNPDDVLASVEDLKDLFRDDVDVLDPDADWDEILDIVQAEQSGQVPTLDVDALYRAAADFAVSRSTRDAADALQKSNTFTKEAGSLVLENSLNDSLATSTQIENSTRGGFKELISLLEPEAGTKLLAFIQDSLTMSKDVITTAIDVAEQSVGSTVVDNMTEVFRQKALSEHLRAINSFAGGMADINAVNSSAFVIGLALQESDFARRVSDFRAQIELQIHSQVIEKYVESFSRVIASYIELFERRSAQYLEAYKAQISTTLQIFMQSMPEYLKSFLQSYISHVSTNTDTSKNYFSGIIQARLSEANQKQAFVNNQLAKLSSMRTDKLNARKAVAALASDVGRVRIVAKNEEYERNLEYDFKSANWDIELFQKGSNVLSAVTGSVVSDAGKPSKTQSVLGGMAAGAALGAEIGTAVPGTYGTAIGAGVGAVVGGVAGAQ